MRGSRTPAIRATQSETQQAFEALSRHRKAQIVETTKTTLVKACQWASGGVVEAELAKALEAETAKLVAKRRS
jgi:hypothetical protein